MLVQNAAVFQPESKKKEQKKHPDQRIIIYQGALNLGRGIELAIQSLEYLENVILWIAGAGDIEANLHALVQDLGFSNRVKFLGKVPLHDLSEFTHQADLGISLEEDLGLNYRYALPNKLFDYIQARIPVVVSDLPEMRSVVEKYKIGKILLKRTPETLGRIINTMINEDIPSGKYASKLELAARELSWQHEEEKLLKLFRKLKK